MNSRGEQNRGNDGHNDYAREIASKFEPRSSLAKLRRHSELGLGCTFKVQQNIVCISPGLHQKVVLELPFDPLLQAQPYCYCCRFQLLKLIFWMWTRSRASGSFATKVSVAALTRARLAI